MKKTTIFILVFSVMFAVYLLFTFWNDFIWRYRSSRLTRMPCSQAQEHIIDRLAGHDKLSRDEINRWLNLAQRYILDDYERYPERNEELMDVLEIMIYEADDLRNIPVIRVYDASMTISRYEPDEYKRILDMMEYCLADDTMMSHDRNIIESRLEELKTGYESLKRRKQREREGIEHAQREAAQAGVELPDGFKDVHEVIIELLSDPEQPDEVIEQILAAAGRLSFRFYMRDDDRKNELKTIIEELLFQHDKRKLDVHRYLSVYESFERRNDAIEITEIIIQKRTEAGLESPDLEKWIEVHPPWEG